MAKNSDNKPISFDEILDVPLEFIKIICDNYIQNILGSNVYCVELLIHYPDISISNSYKTYRNFSEFKDLFDLFLKNNPNEVFPEFPSRYTFLKSQEESKTKYFHKFINRMLELCKDENKKKENLKNLYNFVFSFNDYTISELSNERINEYFNTDNLSETNTEEEDTKSIKSDINENENRNKKINVHSRILSSKNLSFYKNNDNFLIEDKKSNSNNDDNKSIDINLNFDLIKRNTINFMNKQFNSFLNNRDSFINGIKKSISTEVKENIGRESNTWENVYVKTSLNDYSLHTVKIRERCLELFNNEKNKLNEIEKEKIIIENYKDKEDTYYLIIPLYKINIEIFRLVYQSEDINKKEEKNSQKFLKQKIISPSEIYEFCSYSPNSLLYDVNSEIIIRLYHDYDRFETFIKFDQDWRISSIKNFLSKIEQSSLPTQKKSLFINEITESYMDSFGDIMIDIISFKAPNFNGKIKIKVNLEPYMIPTKSLISNGVFNFNQKILLPKHNRFKYLKFFIYKMKEEGLFSKKEAEKLITKYEIPLPKLINIYYLSKEPIIVDLYPIKEKQKKKQKYANMTLEFKFFEWSKLLSLLVKNTNKRVLDDYPLYNKDGDSEEPYTISILLKRIKRCLAMFKDIYYFYKMLEHFKYPILSSTFILLVIFYTFFCEPKYILTHTVIFVVCILIYHSNLFLSHIYPKISPIFLGYRNKYDIPSKIAVTESQKNKAEVAQNDYLIKKSGFSILSIKEIKEYKQAYIDLLFRLSRICSFFEKFRNLFIWTDPLLSLYMTILLILFLLIIWSIQLRYIVCFSICKKFFFGIFFYKNKLINNKEIAKIVVTDAFNIWKKEKEKEKEKDKAKSREKSKEKNNEEKIKATEVVKTMEKKALDDEKLKSILKSKLYEHSNIIIDDQFYDNMETIGDVIEELGKIEDVLKIKRLSYLFNLTKNNSKIYRKDIDPEDVFAYFIGNIKSDYYRASNGFISTDYFKNEDIITDDNFENKNKKSIKKEMKNEELEKIKED